MNRIQTIELGTGVNRSKLTVYSPDETNNTGVAAIICPGGGYFGLALEPQGYDVSEWLNTLGIIGIVLKYRMPYKRKETPFEDVQEAMRYCRTHARELGIGENRVGIIGFSAGGHLAALASTLFADDTRPAFSILFYPVITMEEETNHETKVNLMGHHPSQDEIEQYSCEKQVRPDTPPTLILTSDDDSLVPPINSVLYYEALKKQLVPAALYVFPQGDHAWSLKGKNMFGQDFEYIDQAKALITKWIERYALLL